MKRTVWLLLAVLLVWALALPAAASTQAQLDFITDDAAVLSWDARERLEEAAMTVSEQYQCGIYAAIVEDYTDFGSGEIKDVAQAIYEYYLLGYGPERNGALLLISTEDGICGMVSQGLAARALDGQTQTVLDEAVAAYGSGSYEAVLDTYLARMDALLNGMSLGESASTASAHKDAYLSCSLELDGYVTDLYGLLDKKSEQALEAQASRISQTYDRGVYVIILADYTRYGRGDLYTIAGDIYQASGMGMGAYSDGLLLMLSMDQRNAALISYDGSGQFITAEGKDWLAPQYLEYFRQDRWYEGLDAYVRGSETLLEMAAEGRPMTRRNQPGVTGLGLVVSLVMGFLIALVIMKVMESGMRSVRKEAAAAEYLVGSGIRLTQHSDRFLHRQTTRRQIPKSNSGGSGGNASGGSRRTGSRGFSGRTDRF